MELLRDGYGVPVQGVAKRLGTTYSAAMSTVSAAFSTDFNTDVVRVCATADCFFTIGASPVTATTSSPFLPAGAVEYVGTGGGTGKRLAYMTASASGTFYVSEVR